MCDSPESVLRMDEIRAAKLPTLLAGPNVWPLRADQTVEHWIREGATHLTAGVDTLAVPRDGRCAGDPFRRQDVHLTTKQTQQMLLGCIGDAEPLDVYMAQSTMDEGFPESLAGSLQAPHCVAARTLRRTSVWASHVATVTNLHCDDNDNLLVVLRGSKTVTLLPPDWSPPGVGPLAVEGAGNHCLDTVVCWSPGHAVVAHGGAPAVAEVLSASIGDADSSGPRRRGGPAVLSHKAYQATVATGQGLFVPAGWWHLVQSSPQTIAVSHWFRGPLDEIAAPAMGAPALRCALESVASDGIAKLCLRRQKQALASLPPPVRELVDELAKAVSTPKDVVGAVAERSSAKSVQAASVGELAHKLSLWVLQKSPEDEPCTDLAEPAFNAKRSRRAAEQGLTRAAADDDRVSAPVAATIASTASDSAQATQDTATQSPGALAHNTAEIQRANVIFASCGGSKSFAAMITALAQHSEAGLVAAAGCLGRRDATELELVSMARDLAKLHAETHPALQASAAVAAGEPESVLQAVYAKLDALALHGGCRTVDQLGQAIRDASRRTRAKLMMDAASRCVFGDTT